MKTDERNKGRFRAIIAYCRGALCGGLIISGSASAQTGAVKSNLAGARMAPDEIRGFNWADPGDNYQDGPVLPSGLEVTDHYEQAARVAGVVLESFQNAGANTVRLPINPETVTGSWWAGYKGCIDEAGRRGMNVILATWTGAEKNNGRVNDRAAFFKMWDIVIRDYGGQGNIYFEILNEPFGYSRSEWLGVVSGWLKRYPVLPRNRILVGGTGYCENIPAVASSSITRGCLFSVHCYGYWDRKETTSSYWSERLARRVGPYAERTVLTEFGAVMTGGWNYQQDSTTNNAIASVNGICWFAHTNHLGSVYWPGLRDQDHYSMFYRNNDTTALSLNSASGLRLVQYGWCLPSAASLSVKP